jgi:hypothetical protein
MFFSRLASPNATAFPLGYRFNKEVDPIDEIRIETNNPGLALKNVKPEEIAEDIKGGMTTMSLVIVTN